MPDNLMALVCEKDPKDFTEHEMFWLAVVSGVELEFREGKYVTKDKVAFYRDHDGKLCMVRKAP
jgi:hypothetical protein